MQQAEQEAAARTSQLEAVFEAMTDGVIFFDGQGHLLEINAAGLAMIGRDARPDYSLSSAYGRPSRYFVRDEHGQLLSHDQWPISRILNGETLKNERAVDVIIRTRDGEKQLNVSGAPVYGPEGRIVGAVVVMHDVTERRRFEVALREANRRMDEFLGIASHELKTPLTSIKGYIQLMARRLTNSIHQSITAKSLTNTDSDEQTQFLEGLQDLLERTDHQVGRLNRMVNELLDVSRIQANKLDLILEPCDLATIVQEVIQDQRQINPARTILLELPSDRAVQLLADADRIREVISNYLTNALKYSAEDRPVEVSLQTQEQVALVSVSDEGPGLSPTQQEYIWERFYQVEGVELQSSSGTGLGLGLYICRKIIELHQGEVGVQSVPGKGSTFWFTLPMIKE